MKRTKVQILCEAAMLIALAQILSYIKLYEFPDGGSIDFAMLPIVIFAARYGIGWGTGVGFVFGVMQYFLGNGIAIDWTSMIADYLVAYALLGFGAGLAHNMKGFRMNWGLLIGGLLRFLAHFVVGAVVWGKYMPDTFFGMTMTNVWVYSFLYNAPYMAGCMALVTIAIFILRKPMKKVLGEQM